VIVGPGYTGDLPAGMPVITAPTPYCWIIGRIQTNGPADYQAVAAVQDGMKPTAHTQGQNTSSIPTTTPQRKS